MKSVVAAVAVVSGAYLATAEELPPVDLPQEAQPVIVDPLSGKVWDEKTREWIPFRDQLQRIRERKTTVVEQVPFSPPLVLDGYDVLSRRMDAQRGHWDRTLYLMELVNTPLRFR